MIRQRSPRFQSTQKRRVKSPSRALIRVLFWTVRQTLSMRRALITPRVWWRPKAIKGPSARPLCVGSRNVHTTFVTCPSKVPATNLRLLLQRYRNCRSADIIRETWPSLSFSEFRVSQTKVEPGVFPETAPDKCRGGSFKKRKTLTSTVLFLYNIYKTHRSVELVIRTFFRTQQVLTRVRGERITFFPKTWKIFSNFLFDGETRYFIAC